MFSSNSSIYIQFLQVDVTCNNKNTVSHSPSPGPGHLGGLQSGLIILVIKGHSLRRACLQPATNNPDCYFLYPYAAVHLDVQRHAGTMVAGSKQGRRTSATAGHCHGTEKAGGWGSPG